MPELSQNGALSVATGRYGPSSGISCLDELAWTYSSSRQYMLADMNQAI